LRRVGKGVGREKFVGVSRNDKTWGKRKNVFLFQKKHEETPFAVVYHQFRKHSHCFLIIPAGEGWSLRHGLSWRPKLDLFE